MVGEIGSPSDRLLPAGSPNQRRLPIRGSRSEFHPGLKSTTGLAAEHRRQSARPEPTPAVPDPPVHGRETSVSSNSSGYSMDRDSLASSATSAHQPGTNRPSPTPLPTPMPVHESHRKLVPLETLTRTRVLIHHDLFATEVAGSLFGSSSVRTQHQHQHHHHCGPVEPPAEGFSQPQRKLPAFETLLPPLIPANWIGPDAPGRRSRPVSPRASSRVVPRVRGNGHSRSPPLLQRSQSEHRSQRSAKIAVRKRKRRGNLAKDATGILLIWFFDHIGHPYPTEEEKHILMGQTGLMLSQVSGSSKNDVLHAFADRGMQISNWFINARRRKLPKLDQEAETELRLRIQAGASSTVPFRPSVSSDGATYRATATRESTRSGSESQRDSSGSP